VVKPEEHPATPDASKAGPEAFAGSLIDERFAENLRTARTGMGISQGELARQMAARGWPYYAQTVNRVEAGQRKVSVGEAKSLAEILRTTIDMLTWPGREASAVGLFDRTLGRAHVAYEQIIAWTRELLYAQFQLRKSLEEAERADYLGSARVRELARQARLTLDAPPESALMSGHEQHESLLRAPRDASASDPSDIGDKEDPLMWVENDNPSPEQAVATRAEVMYLTVAEVAHLLREPEKAVRQLIHSGELPSIHAGRGVRIPEHALAEHLAKSQNASGTSAGQGSS